MRESPDPDEVFDMRGFAEIDKELSRLITETSKSRARILKRGPVAGSILDMFVNTRKELAILNMHMIKISMVYRMMNANQEKLHIACDNLENIHKQIDQGLQLVLRKMEFQQKMIELLDKKIKLLEMREK